MRIVKLAFAVVICGCFSASAPPKIHADAPTLTYCELVSDPARFDGQIVRVSGTYLSGFEQSQLTGDHCDHRTWVDFTKEYEPNSNKRVTKMFESLDGPLEIVAVGRFTGSRPTRTVFGRVIHDGFGHMGASDFKFDVLAIESVRTTHGPRP